MKRMNFFEELKEQRWDDHRYYHHSRINQSLHLLSAISFLTAYTLLVLDPKHPTAAVIFGWIIAMVSRQIGHFFFEPKGFDDVNQVSHEHKEAIKVGYNLRRKVVLMSIWILSPAILYYNPSLFGLMQPHLSWPEFVDNLALIWLALAVGALLFRTVHLFFLKGVQSGLVWLTKILTDPFHDIKLYYKAPLHLIRREMLDPMTR
jgi:hypothetical protein